MSDKIYIMPAGAISAVAYYVLTRGEINKHENVIGFLDSNKGKIEGAVFCDMPVYTPECADRDAKVIVASFNYSKPIIRQLDELGFKNVVDAKSLMTAEQAVTAFRQMREDNVEQDNNLLPLGDRINSYFIDAEANSGELTLPRIEFVLTERCTLKCRDCCLLMPYYTNPRDIETDVLLRSADKLFEYADYIRVINIVGGEPLLVKNLPLFLDKLSEYRGRIGDLHMTTNGTLTADADTLDAMKRAGLYIHISDYGELSRNKDALMRQAEQAGVKCEFRPNLYWWPRAAFTEENDDPKSIFDRCDEFCAQIIDGKLYYCCFAAQGDALRGFPENSGNYVDLLAPDTTKECVRAYMERTKPLPACSWCTGCDATRAQIPVAVQVSGTLPYKRYD